MSIYDHTRPINDGDIKKAKTFYDIVCWGGLLRSLWCAMASSPNTSPRCS